MGRSLVILFQRDPSRDRVEGDIAFEGYRMCWPDGVPVSVGLDALCSYGQRLLGLGVLLQGRQERLLDLLCFPQVTGRENMTRVPGYRVRRFFIERRGEQGRMHFMDGTPTAIVFDLVRDDERVLAWLGLVGMAEGQRVWFDLTACPVGEELDAEEAPVKVFPTLPAAVLPTIPA